MRFLQIIAASALSICPQAGAAQVGNLEVAFDERVRPFVQTYCGDCHGGAKPKAKFDLGPYKTVDSVVGDFGHWELILDRLVKGEMPPEDEETQPSPAMRAEMIGWIRAIMKREAEKNAGDPGVVLARRLSNAEYDYTIRDLTGVDLRPTREFPIDPANLAGFDNSGESLSLSPALMKKYLEAAKSISEHLVLLPGGFSFASHPVMTDTDRDKFGVNRVVGFYKRQPTRYADYFLAAWKLKHVPNSGAASRTLRQIADESGISARYLATIWQLLSGHDLNSGPIATLRARFNALPAPDAATEESIVSRCKELGDDVHALRQKLSRKMPFPKAPELHQGSQTVVMWHNRQQAANRRTLNVEALRTTAGDPGLVISEDGTERAAQVAAFENFCSVFPDTFYIAERGREYLDKKDGETLKNEQGRLLSAGFHSMMGYFRDDIPLCELILSEESRRELDALWAELDFVTDAPTRQFTGFVWFERTDSRFMRGEEFDFARAEDKDVTSVPKLERLARVYLAKAVNNGADEQAQQAVKEYFANINASIRRVEQARKNAEPSHLQALLTFAARAYRRPLTTAEQESIVRFHHALRARDGVSHEDALRDGIVSILVSPHFWYRVDLPAEQPGIHALSDLALASRLSYFLWSSMPDDALRNAAAAGELHKPDVLLAQTRRMLRDSRARGLALEFGGNWLGFRQFENHNGVDRERFPTFTSALRESMFEEPVRFFTSVIRDNRPVLDFLFADDTFVNPALAAHYGIELRDAASDNWTQVRHRGNVGRGGLLPMAVFQTQNSPGLRTSPVKRGYWVVRQLLGERIPPPPPTVPELPGDERLGDLTLREHLVRHREDKACAGCHERFDSIGLAFESYGPVGEIRTLDLGGRPVDVRAVFPGGVKGAGLDGLKSYLREHRQDEFVDNLCRKLLSYALGRTLILSDNPMLDAMKTKLKADGYRMHSLIESIVTSPQFLTQRGRAELSTR